MEAAVIGATGVLAQEEPWAPTRAPNDIINIENYNNRAAAGRLSPRAVSTGGASSAPFPFGG